MWPSAGTPDVTLTHDIHSSADAEGVQCFLENPLFPGSTFIELLYSCSPKK